MRFARIILFQKLSSLYLSTLYGCQTCSQALSSSSLWWLEKERKNANGYRITDLFHQVPFLHSFPDLDQACADDLLTTVLHWHCCPLAAYNSECGPTELPLDLEAALRGDVTMATRGKESSGYRDQDVNPLFSGHLSNSRNSLPVLTVNLASFKRSLLLRDCAIIIWRGGGWEMGKIRLKIKSHPPLSLGKN